VRLPRVRWTCLPHRIERLVYRRENARRGSGRAVLSYAAHTFLWPRRSSAEAIVLQ